MPFPISFLGACLFIQFVTITQPLFNTLQTHVSPMLVVLFQFLFLFSRKLRVFDVIFHTFNCHLLELIKIQTLNLTSNELLCYLGIKITLQGKLCICLLTFPLYCSSLIISTIISTSLLYTSPHKLR